MAKPSRGSASPSDTTRAARAAFPIPAPKGPNPGPIPKSTRYVAPPADDDEEAAFASLAERRGQRGRASHEGLEAARLRMAGVRVEDEADEADAAMALPLPTDEEIDNGPAPMLVNRAPHNAGTPATPASRPTLPPTFTPFRGAQGQGQSSRDRITSPHAPSLEAGMLRAEDVDRLWDWIRQDADGGQHFLGRTFATSIELHAFMKQIFDLESSGLAIMRSLYWSHEHFGFAMLAPILAAERTTLLHIYLRQDARGSLGQLVGPLIEIATIMLPNVHLAVYSPDDAWERLHQRLLTPLGFRKHAMFIR